MSGGIPGARAVAVDWPRWLSAALPTRSPGPPQTAGHSDDGSRMQQEVARGVLRDPITFELFKNAAFSLADEMALTILRTAYSGVLKDIMDYSTALCDAKGQLGRAGPHPAGPLGIDPRRDRLDARQVRRHDARRRHLLSQRSVCGRDALARHLHLQAGLLPGRGRRDRGHRLPPHRRRRPRAGFERLGLHRDLRRRAAHPAAQDVRRRRSK